jgi:Dolichyl-phosphate-mannose-protein mannosyltransferase
MLRPFERVYDALSDAKKADRTAGLLIVLFAALYTLHAVIANASTGLHQDLGELVAWSRRPAWGFKHPPMSAMVALVWFAVFPLADWSAYLLAMVVSASAVWIAWRVCREWLPSDRWPLSLAMLMLIPLYSFHALKFNANTVMMPFWAAATLYFLRSNLARDVRSSVLTGIAASGAMLGKYWSVNLLAGLGLAALFDRNRRSYLISKAPWITIAAALLTFLPHLLWLRSEGGQAMRFAMSIHGENATPLRSLSYVAGCVGYAIVPLLLFASLRPSRAALRDTVRPPDRERALIAMVFWIPLVLPAILNVVVPTRLTALWTMPNWTLLPVVLLGSTLVTVTRRTSVIALVLALVVPIAAVAAAPLVAMQNLTAREQTLPSQFQMLARSAQEVWHRTSAAPMPLLGGDQQLSTGAAFYATDRPIALVESPGDARSQTIIERDGIVLLCQSTKIECRAAQDSAAVRWRSVRSDVRLRRFYRGVPGPAVDYVIVAIPPGAR